LWRCVSDRARRQTIREALAKGADRRSISRPKIQRLRPPGAARLMRRRSGLKLPTCDRHPERRSGLRADRPSWRSCSAAHATLVMEVEKLEGGIRVKRELEDGWFPACVDALPALVTVNRDSNCATPPHGDQEGKTKEVRRLTPRNWAGSKARPASTWTVCTAPARQAYPALPG